LEVGYTNLGLDGGLPLSIWFASPYYMQDPLSIPSLELNSFFSVDMSEEPHDPRAMTRIADLLAES
jgi:hypothetical protein